MTHGYRHAIEPLPPGCECLVTEDVDRGDQLIPPPCGCPVHRRYGGSTPLGEMYAGIRYTPDDPELTEVPMPTVWP